MIFIKFFRFQELEDYLQNNDVDLSKNDEAYDIFAELGVFMKDNNLDNVLIFFKKKKKFTIKKNKK